MANEFITRKGFRSLDDSQVSGSLFVSGTIEATQTAVLEGLENANADTDKFLVASADGTVKFRTGTEVLSDIGAGGAANLSGAPSEVTYFNTNSEVTSSRRFYLLNTGSDPLYGSGGDAQAVIIQGQLQVINDPTRNVGGSSPMQILVGSGSTGDINNPQYDSFIALEQESAVVVGLRAHGSAPTAAQIKMRTDINDAYSIGRLTNPYNQANTLRIKPMTFMEGGLTITGSLTVSGSNTFRNIGPAYFTEGNVGIGTTTPSDKLDVHGIIALNSVAFISQSGNTGFIGDIDAIDAIGNLDINTAGASTRLFLDDSGHVGVNTDTPNYSLDIALAASSDRLNITRGGAQKAYITGDGAGIFYAQLVSYGNSLSGGGGIFTYRGGTATQTIGHRFQHVAGGPFSATSGDQTMLKIEPIVSQSGTAGYTGIKLDVTETNIGSGTNNLLDLQVDGVTKYAVDRDGDVTIGGDLTVEGIVTAQEFHTEFVSASIIYQSGSTQFGNSADDLHSFTGSVDVLVSSTAGNRSFILNGEVGPRLQRRGDLNGWAMEYGFNANDGTDVGGFGGYGTGNSALQWWYIGDSHTSAPFVVKPGGTVSVGTTTTYTTGGTAKLTVGGGGPISLGASNSDLMYIRRFGAGEYQWQTFFNSNSGEIHLQPYGGVVGIGTTSPDSRLHVNGTVKFEDDLTISGSSPAIKFQETGQATNEAYLGIGGNRMTVYTGRTGGSRNNFWLRVGDSSVSSTPTIFASGSNGFVGIKNETPHAELTVGGKIDTSDIDNGAFRIYNGSTFRGGWGTADWAGANFGDDANDLVAYVNGSNNYYIGTNAQPRLTVTGAGNVGIGTTSPVDLLDVRGGKSYFSPKLASSGGTDSHAIVVWNNNDTAFTSNALTAYNAHTSWDIGSKSSYTISSRPKDGSIYTFAGENSTANVAINRYVQFDSSNTSPLLNWTFFQWDGAGTSALDLKRPQKLWSIQTYEGAAVDTKLIFSGSGQMQLSKYGSGNFTGTPAYRISVDSSGNLIEESLGAGAVDGLGSARYITRWEDTDTLTSSSIYEDASGNIGIGTTTTSYKLTVQGGNNGINLSGTGAYLRWNSGDMQIRNEGSYKMGFYTYNITAAALVNRMVIDTDGNVGIGTTSPSSKLHVENAGNTWAKFINTSGTNQRLDVGTNSSDQHFVYGYGAYPLLLGTNGNTRMTVTSDGDVGIGTTTPQAKLQVVGGADVVNIEGSGSTANTSIFSIDGNNGRLFEVSDDLSDSLFSVNTIAGLPVLEVFADNRVVAGAYNQNDFVISGSRVGIGTDAPAEKLHLSGSQRIDGEELYLTTPGSSRKPVRLHRVDSKGAITLQRDGVDNVRISSDESTIGHTYFNGNGTNVGIGTTSPSSKLHIVSSGTAITADAGTGLVVQRNADTFNGAVVAIIGGTGGNSNLDFGDADDQNIGRIAYSHTDDSMRFTTNTSEKVRITSTGNVGIGTTSPYQKLHVNGNIYLGANDSAGYFIHSGYDVALSADAHVLIVADSNDTSGEAPAGDIIFGGGSAVNTNSDPDFTFANAYPSRAPREEWMRITNGNVGIGITSPQSPLSVQESQAAANNRIIANFSKTSSGNQFGSSIVRVGRTQLTELSASLDVQALDLEFNSGGGGPFRYGTYADAIISNGSSANNGQYGSLHFATSGSVWMTVAGGTNAGNVGIGTESPDARLEVNTANTSDVAINANERLKILGNGTMSWGASNDYGQLSWDTGYALYRGQSGKGIKLQVNSSSTVMTLTTGNQVGINNTTPSYRLDIKNTSSEDANIALRNTSTGDAGIWFDASNGDLVGGDYAWAGQRNSKVFEIRTSANAGNIYLNSRDGAGAVDINGDLTVSGIVTAQEFHTEFVSASIIYQSGSTQFGDTSDDEHDFIGSVTVTRNPGVSQGTVMVIENTGDYGSSSDLVLKNAYDRDIGIKFETGGGIYHQWLDSNGDDAMIFSAAGTTRTTDATLILQQNHDVVIPNGDLGIGTTPSYPLDVSSGTSTWTARFQRTGTPHLRFENTADNGDFAVLYAANNLFKLARRSGSNAEQNVWLFGDSTGNVGVGTDTPAGRFNSYISATRQITHNGNGGDFSVISDNNSAPVAYIKGTGTADLLNVFDNTTEVFTILDGGNVGIATTSPSEKLHVVGKGLFDGNRDVLIDSNLGNVTISAPSSGGWSTGMFFKDAGGNAAGGFGTYGTATALEYYFIGDAYNDTTMVIQPNAGNVGIGTDNPTYKLDVAGEIGIDSYIRHNDDTNTYFGFNGADSYKRHIAGGDRFVQTSTLAYFNTDTYINGEFSQGVSTANKVFNYGAEFRSSGASIQIVFGRDANNTGSGAIGADENSIFSAWNVDSGASEKFRIGKAGAIQAYYYGSGNVTGTPAYNLQVDASGNIIETAAAATSTVGGSGVADEVAVWSNASNVSGSQSFTWDGNLLFIDGVMEAREKSFNIKHPTKEDKRLIYGVLEGPEHGVYCRGKVEGKVIELPEEWTGLVDEDTITVQLTSIGSHQNLYVKDIKDNKIFISNGNLLSSSIKAFYFVQAMRKDVKPLVTERDA